MDFRLIKASAGGGGKGMRDRSEREQFLSQLERAAGEALASFGDSVFIEKYVENPRHVKNPNLRGSNGQY